ncbi:ethanolamine ammonia-lyase [Marinobacter sp. EhC06]|jgi:ethanolamine ammonia-lyase small subunit|uniref:ethanolamine ammonia-lyase subunit EutC n=1 Tax=Marinobacter TaxID=2742 RepID=UPI0007D8D9E0|nr:MULTISPECIES: ethanolamine ammonia-lyase subunit EutC [unclassified Marinobacter]OAN88072.1 ethanolamine ammonia-lyase [Marinobacter sp. EhN04]OAN91056.1 ethanolamine ammonia-lyase [Marinobacter sp. EhC06]
MPERKPVVTENPWRPLSAWTDARIGLGRAGISLPTREMLAFQLAHAQARDAVHLPLDTDRLMAGLEELTGSRKTLLRHDPVHLQSQACDRITYLQRPDLGRRLSSQSSEELDRRGHTGASPADLALVIADGLSSYGVQQNAIAFLEALLTDIEADDQSWELAPLVVVSQGRVAIGDDVGHRLNARCVVVLIGERPGLSSPDSLGLYLTWQPGPGLTDASRNCISNIRLAGLSWGEASRRLMYLLREARRQKVSGVPLKDRSEETVIEQGIGNFLLR